MNEENRNSSRTCCYNTDCVMFPYNKTAVIPLKMSQTDTKFDSSSMARKRSKTRTRFAAPAMNAEYYKEIDDITVTIKDEVNRYKALIQACCSGTGENRISRITGFECFQIRRQLILPLTLVLTFH